MRNLQPQESGNSSVLNSDTDMTDVNSNDSSDMKNKQETIRVDVWSFPGLFTMYVRDEYALCMKYIETLPKKYKHTSVVGQPGIGKHH